MIQGHLGDSESNLHPLGLVDIVPGTSPSDDLDKVTLIVVCVVLMCECVLSRCVYSMLYREFVCTCVFITGCIKYLYKCTPDVSHVICFITSVHYDFNKFYQLYNTRPNQSNTHTHTTHFQTLVSHATHFNICVQHMQHTSVSLCITAAFEKFCILLVTHLKIYVYHLQHTCISCVLHITHLNIFVHHIQYLNIFEYYI